MRWTTVTMCCVLTVGCGDNGGGGTSDAVSSTGAGPGTSGSSGEPEVTGDPVTTGSSTSTGETPTTGEPPTGGTTGSESSGGAGSTTEEGSSSSGDESSTGASLDCDAIEVELGPFDTELFVSGFKGSEDLAFDGKGGLALKRNGEVVIVRADKSETVLTTGVPAAYGTRFLADGRLLVALPQGGKVIAVDGDGMSTDFLGGLAGPNGVFPDLEGAVWITEFGGDRVIRVGADMSKTTIVTGDDAGSANGIVYDAGRGLLFYTNYQSGQIRRVAIDEQGTPGTPEVVASLKSASPDGLTLDACGNLYVVDQSEGRLSRVLLDASGAAIGEPAGMVTTPSNIANVQFGAGEGFDDHTLYLSGNPGDVYAVKVEFPGAPNVVVK